MMSSGSADFITIVSGLPRSGTSLMMQMLNAGGIPPLTDQIRTADEDNPRGYYELERVKQIKSDRAWLTEAVGRAVKIVHLLLMDLPETHQYRVVFMHRDMSEVVRSQAAMLGRLGRASPTLPPDRLTQVYASQLTLVRKWLDERPAFKVLDVQYRDVIRAPAEHAQAVNAFLGGELDTRAMIAAIDPALYRNRSDA